MICIAIVDDHQIVIDGLRLLLGRHKGFVITAEATAGNRMLELLSTVQADLLLIDMMMPEMDGYELALLVREKYPEIKILALSMNSDGASVDKMIAGARINGYILKTSDKNELITAIESIASGCDYYSEEILEELKGYHKIKKQNTVTNLTIRELEVIRCILDGMTNKQIAQALYISEYTVESHRKNIFRKTDTHTALSLAEYVRAHKLF